MNYKRLLITQLLLLTSMTTLYAQCGFLAGKVTDITGSTTLKASLSAKTDQGKVRLGRTDSTGVFNVEMPCNVSVLIIESAQYQSLHMPVNADGKLEGTYYVSFALLPLVKQTSDEPYAQSEQTHFELKDTTKTQTSIIRRIEVKDALSNESLAAEVCLYYTHKQKKDCFNLVANKPSLEVIFTEKDIVAIEVKASGYQSYNGNLILDKTDEEPRTYVIKLNKQHTMLSINIMNAKAGISCRLNAQNGSSIALNKMSEGHYFAELAPGKAYQFGVTLPDQPEFSTAVASIKEGLNLKSIRLSDVAKPAAVLEKINNNSTITASNRTLYFPRSDYKLPLQSRTYLDSVAIYMAENKGKALRITGHTDNVGNPALNLTLSEYRVRVITRYLINKGVPEKLIASAGLGSKQPVVPNDTEENRRLNRRVEVQIIDLQEKSN